MLEAFNQLYVNYKTAILSGGGDADFVARVMAAVCERVLLEISPAAYTFPSFHTRLTDPYDYYAFGQRYIRCACGGGVRGGVRV